MPKATGMSKNGKIDLVYDEKIKWCRYNMLQNSFKNLSVLVFLIDTENLPSLAMTPGTFVWLCDLFPFRNGYLMFFPGCCTFQLRCLRGAWLITWLEKVCDWIQILCVLQNVVFCYTDIQGKYSGEKACLAPIWPMFDSSLVQHIVGWVCYWFLAPPPSNKNKHLVIPVLPG